MNVDAVKNAVKAIPSTLKNGTDAVGEASIKYAKEAGSFVSGKLKLKKPQNFDTFVSSAKDKAPEFVKTTGRFVKNNKNTFVGAAVILAAVGCATAIIKTVVDKIKETRNEALQNEKISMHQG